MQARECNVFLVTGNDEFQIAAKARAIVREHAGENPDAFALDTVLESDDQGPLEALNQFIRSLLTPSFLGGRKTVWLKGFSAFSEDKKSGPLAKPFERLCEIVEAGVPPDVVAVMSGPDADPKRRLFQACEASGQVVVQSKPDVRARGWQEQVVALIVARAREKQIEIEADACELLMQTVGTDTPRIDCELEKLVCYIGQPARAVGVADVQLLCHGEGETVSWALQEALGARKVGDVLRVLDALLSQQRDEENAVHGLVLHMADYVRQLLQMKLFMFGAKIRSPAQVKREIFGMNPADQKVWYDQGIEVVTAKPFRAQMLAEASQRFTGPELVDGLIELRDVCWLCVSSTSSTRAAFERVLAGLCRQRAA